MDKRSVAYFSMEIGINAEIPTYSGGLGVLAGDTIRAAADLRVPMVAITLIHRKGYFRQILDSVGNQTEQPVDWVVEDFFQEEPIRVSVNISGRTVWIRAWRHDVVGIEGYSIPVFALAPNCPKTRNGIEASPTISTGVTITTGCVRRSFWASAGSAFCGPWATRI